jgi:ATP-dependent DNA helicase RecQ
MTSSQLRGSHQIAGSRPDLWSSPAGSADPDDLSGVIQTRRAELAQMQAYMVERGCLMEFLTRLLDDPDPRACGRCVNCTGRGLPREADSALVHAAIEFLRRDLGTIEPRKRWPADLDNASGTIKPANEFGMALCVYGDAGTVARSNVGNTSTTVQ